MAYFLSKSNMALRTLHILAICAMIGIMVIFSLDLNGIKGSVNDKLSFHKSSARQPASRLREKFGLDSGPFLGTGYVDETILNMDRDQSQTAFHNLMADVTYFCPNISRYGNKGDGGYELCLDKRFRPQLNSCLVYSFGVNHDFSFEDAVNSEFGCEVHSFDPSMKMDDHIHREPNMFFHNLGLSGSDSVNNMNWTLETITTIMNKLGHQNRIIDVLKIDIEGAEWPFLVQFVESDAYKQVKQLIIEPHTPRQKKDREMTVIDYAEAFDDFAMLRKVGFERFLFHTRNNCCGAFQILTRDYIINAQRSLCCYEQFFVNTKI